MKMTEHKIFLLLIVEVAVAILCLVAGLVCIGMNWCSSTLWNGLLIGGYIGMVIWFAGILIWFRRLENGQGSGAEQTESNKK